MIYREGNIIKDKSTNGLFLITGEHWGYDCILRYSIWSLDDRTHKRGISIPTMQNNYIKEQYSVGDVFEGKLNKKRYVIKDVTSGRRLVMSNIEYSEHIMMIEIKHLFEYYTKIEGEKEMKNNMLEVKVEIKRNSCEEGRFNLFINDKDTDYFKITNDCLTTRLSGCWQHIFSMSNGSYREYRELLDKYLVEEEPKELTISELEKQLGYKIKIVGEQ